jgi:hypothetical protein
MSDGGVSGGVQGGQTTSGSPRLNVDLEEVMRGILSLQRAVSEISVQLKDIQTRIPTRPAG